MPDDGDWSDLSRRSREPYTQPSHAQHSFGRELVTNDPFIEPHRNEYTRQVRCETVPFNDNRNPFTPVPRYQANPRQSTTAPRFAPSHSIPYNYPLGLNNYPSNAARGPSSMIDPGGSYYSQPEPFLLSSATPPEDDYFDYSRYQPESHAYPESPPYQTYSSQPAARPLPRRPRGEPRRTQESSSERSTPQKPKKKIKVPAKVEKDEPGDQQTKQMMSSLLDAMEERFKFGTRHHDVWSDPGILREIHRMRSPSAFSQYTSDDLRSSSSRRGRNTDQLLNKLLRLLEQSDPNNQREERDSLLEDRVLSLLKDRLNSNDRTMLQPRDDRHFRSTIEQVVEDILERRSSREDVMPQRLASSENHNSGDQRAPSRMQFTPPSDWQQDDTTSYSSQKRTQDDDMGQSIQVNPNSEATYKLGRHRSFTVHPRKNNRGVVITIKPEPDSEEKVLEENQSKSSTPQKFTQTRLSPIFEDARISERGGGQPGLNRQRSTQGPAVNTSQPRSRPTAREHAHAANDQYSDDDSVFVPERRPRRYHTDRVHQDQGLRRVPPVPEPPSPSRWHGPGEYD